MSIQNLRGLAQFAILVLGIAAVPASVSQNPSPSTGSLSPIPVIVARYSQTNAVAQACPGPSPITIYTPKQEGLFRATVEMLSGIPSVQAGLSATDSYGMNYAQAYDGPSDFTAPLHSSAGQPITLWVCTVFPPPFSQYSVYVVLEQLDAPMPYQPGDLQTNGTAKVIGSGWRLTDGGKNEAGSVFTKQPVFIESFSTDFTFLLTNPTGDGITFTIQGDSPTALGANASDLGYGGIPNSMAIKFDMHNNVGEGNNSTGRYVGGESPTLPAIDLNGTGIDLHSGDPFHVSMTYDGSTLNTTITDTITQASWTHPFQVTIPAHVGGNNAYVGFTGSTGGVTSTQTITSWTFVPKE